jgi:hypothetical protein
MAIADRTHHLDMSRCWVMPMLCPLVVNLQRNSNSQGVDASVSAVVKLVCEVEPDHYEICYTRGGLSEQSM